MQARTTKITVLPLLPKLVKHGQLKDSFSETIKVHLNYVSVFEHEIQDKVCILSLEANANLMKICEIASQEKFYKKLVC